MSEICNDCGGEVGECWCIPMPGNAEQPQDNINPDHYKQGSLETIEILEAVCESISDSVTAGLLFTCVKYLCRHEHKGTPVEDLEKASWYLKRATDRVRGVVEAPTSIEIKESVGLTTEEIEERIRAKRSDMNLWEGSAPTAAKQLGLTLHKCDYCDTLMYCGPDAPNICIDCGEDDV